MTSDDPLDLGPTPEPQRSAGADEHRQHLDLGATQPSSAGAAVGSELDLGGSGRPDPGNHPVEGGDLGFSAAPSGRRTILDAHRPVVMLTPDQSRQLRFAPATQTQGQVLLGIAYERTDTGEYVALPGMPGEPQCVDARPDAVTVHPGTLRRFLVIALPQTPDRSMPGGTLVVETEDGTRVECALPVGATYGAQVLMTGHLVGERLVLRDERDPYSGDLQQVTGAYGYDQLTWRGPFSPVL